MDKITKSRNAVESALEGLCASALNYANIVQEDEFDSKEALEQFREDVRWTLYEEFNAVMKNINLMIETLDAETVY